jgi:hypothetical protein
VDQHCRRRSRTKRAKQDRCLVAPRGERRLGIRARASGTQEIAVRARNPVLALDGDDDDVGLVAIESAAGIEDFLAEETESGLVQIDVEPAGEAPRDQVVVEELRL